MRHRKESSSGQCGCWPLLTVVIHSAALFTPDSKQQVFPLSVEPEAKKAQRHQTNDMNEHMHMCPSKNRSAFIWYHKVDIIYVYNINVDMYSKCIHIYSIL